MIETIMSYPTNTIILLAILAVVCLYVLRPIIMLAVLAVIGFIMVFGTVIWVCVDDWYYRCVYAYKRSKR